MTISDLLGMGPVIPVIVLADADRAVPLANALVKGGVRVIEVTLRTPAALDAVRRIADAAADAIVGVGTITRPQDFAAAKSAGARFGVSPGLTPELAQAARESGLPLLPGVMTPSDVIAAATAGFGALKLFPAQQAGGIGMLKALAGPFPDVRFCPTGGITAETAPDFLALPNVACVGGSWLTPKRAVEEKDWAGVTALARAASLLRPKAAHRPSECEVFSLDGVTPSVDPAAFVHPTSVLIGDVVVGAHCYVGPGAVLRGDFGRLELRAGSNVQDNCVLHSFPGEGVLIEEDGHIGHGAVLHGCTIRRNALVGINAVILDGAEIGEDSIVGAGALVSAKFVAPPRSLVVGSPARVRRTLAPDEIDRKAAGTRHYQRLAARCLAGMARTQPRTGRE